MQTRPVVLVVLLAIAAAVLVLPAGSVTEAGEADDDVLVLADGGQFVFWSFGDGVLADEVFRTVVIAWFFDGTTVSWSSFVPVLGVVNFVLQDGDVLWIVSDGAQEIAVGGGPAGPEFPQRVVRLADGAIIDLPRLP